MFRPTWMHWQNTDGRREWCGDAAAAMRGGDGGLPGMHRSFLIVATSLVFALSIGLLASLKAVATFLLVQNPSNQVLVSSTRSSLNMSHYNYPSESSVLGNFLLMKSISLFGSPLVWNPFVEKINSHACVRVIIMGGSISEGQGLHGLDNYAKHLERALNVQYPDCFSSVEVRGSHAVENMAVRGKGTNYWVNRMAERNGAIRRRLQVADLVIVETAVNDIKGLTNLGPTLSWGKETRNKKCGVVQIYTEILIHQFLGIFRSRRHNFPVLWFTASWRLGDRGFGESDRLNESSHYPTRHANEQARMVLKHYDFPQSSMLDLFMPLSSKSKRQFVGTNFISDIKAIRLPGVIVSARR